MTAHEQAVQFRRNYKIGLMTMVGACTLLALVKERPSRGLAILGAAAGSATLYVAAAWPATRRVAADLVAEKVETEVKGLIEGLMTKKA